MMLKPMRIVASAALSLFVIGANSVRAEEGPTYERDVRPIFAAHCFRCHGEKSRKAELSLSSAAGVRIGGESGKVIVPKKAKESLLYKLVLAGDMPPEEDKRLTTREIATITKWIEGGARFAEQPHDSVATAQHEVLPILYRRCVMCHGPEYQQGELDVRNKTSLLKGGVTGPALVESKPNKSLMVTRVRDRLCPPKADIGEAGIEPTTPEELKILVKWIASGAPYKKVKPEVGTLHGDSLVSEADRDFWSFRPPVRSRLPAVKQTHLVRTPVDVFLLSKLESNGLTFAEEANRFALLRRAVFALTGLPPSPEQVSRFISDQPPDAYERLIDRLLASPRYGEKWARFWLDLAGYADSEGKRQADMIRPYAYRYRDYVIRAFNADMGYDTFLMEQLAGDELVDYADAKSRSPEVIDKLVATGFLRMAPDGTSADPVNRFSDRVEVIADEIDVLGRGVMGLTLKCARCHSHKYDPIPQRDYYRFVAIFKGAYDEYDWLTPQPFTNQWKMAKRRHLEVALPDEIDEIAVHNAPLHEQITKLQAKQKNEQDKQQAKKVGNAIKKLKAQLREAPRIRALWDRGRPSPTYVYRRGVETQPGRLVGPGVLTVLTDGKTRFVVEPPPHASPKTGRRLALAKWLTQSDHPLTARVFVNRIWHQHFGKGIVASLDNFGKLGTPPSHPELLDWLAVEFVQSGWSVKDLHRLIMTSTAYRQRSALTEQHEKLDPENRLVSRMPMRRLRAEEVRDSILFVSGRLSDQPFGKPDPVEIRKDGLVTSKASRGGWRRSIYVRHRRKEMPTILETFDLPQMNPNCTQRMDSTVVSQPLHLLNNKMIYELSRAFAERIEHEVVAEFAKTQSPQSEFLQIQLQDKIARAYLLAYGRTATDVELVTGVLAVDRLTRQWQQQDMDDSHAGQHALADFCHVLLNSAAFLYVD